MAEPPNTSDTPWIPPHLREPPWMDHEPGFKDSAFSWAMGELILERIAMGETVKEITADPRMPSYATVYRWTHVVSDFGQAWRELRWRLGRAAQGRAVEVERWRGFWIAHRRRVAGKPPQPWNTKPRGGGFRACQAMVLCFDIGEGAALDEALRRPGAPSAKAVYRWLRRSAWFRREYAEACALRDFMLCDQAQDLAVSYGYAARPQAEAMIGRAGRLRPRVWG